MLAFFQRRKIPIGLALALMLIVINTVISYRSVNVVIADNVRVTSTYKAIGDLQTLFSMMQDVETGQRGYLLTGQNEYLEPHDSAIAKLPEQLTKLEEQLTDDASLMHVEQLYIKVEERITFSRKVVALRRKGDVARAQALVATGQGKIQMDAIRDLVGRLEDTKISLLEARAQELADSSRNARLTLSLAALANLTLLGLVYYLIVRELAERKRVETRMSERTRLAMLGAEVSLLLTRDEAMPTIFRKCAEAMVAQLDAALARIWTLDDDKQTLELQASAGMDNHLGGTHGNVPVGHFKIGRIAAERMPYLTNQAIGDPQVGEQEWARREGMKAFAGYPMIVGDRLIGVIAVFSRHELGVHALRALETVADAVALGIQRRQAEAELAQSEARKSSVLKTALDCVITMDHTHHIVEWNPAAEKTFGYSRAEAIGQILPELIIPESLRHAHQAGMQKYLETGKSTILNQRIEVSALRRCGEEFPIELSISRIEGEGTPFFTAYLRDITQRQKTEHDLQRARDNAETANKTKSLFLANMSHELRTPLNAILGYSEMLREEAEEDGLDTFTPDLEKIHGAGKHLLTLINDILDLSKIEAGRMELYLEVFDVADVVSELTAIVAPLLEKNRNTLRLELCDGLGEMNADLTKVRQSILNLLSNAAKFSHDGEIVVHAQRERVNERDWIAIRVQDTGIGISSEQMMNLFRPFTQADSSTTRKFGGTGLGLALTRRFCEMMGGDVTVASVPASGSTFTLRIPAIVEAVGDVHELDRENADFLEEAFQNPTPSDTGSTPAGSTPNAAQALPNLGGTIS